MANFLQEIRVVDLSQVWAGPWMGAILADMGAEVIKVETNTRMDVARVLGPFVGGKTGMMGPQEGAKEDLNRSCYFNSLNRGKKSCTINLKHSQGAELFKNLVGISDVVIENFSPRVMASLGLDYAVLKEIKPDIIMVSLSGFGAIGPDRDYVAYAPVMDAVSGVTSSTGRPGEEPKGVSANSGDPSGGVCGALCVLTALNYRYKTNKGLYIDISSTENMIPFIPEVIMEYIMNGRIRPRMGNQDEIMAPHSCYPCKGEDKWVAIAISTDEEWQALCHAMGDPDWAGEEKFADQLSRWHNQVELDALISEWTRSFTPYEVMKQLQEIGIAAGPTLNMEELINDPHMKERRVFIEKDHKEAGETLVFRPPWTSALTEVNLPAPCLGEHNEYVFKKLLGISNDNFNQLVEEKVIY